ncbi:MAG: hypothetical protein GY812_15460 [Actinomycetia bacterium]|nr:hypothetical protein [Actinomycetes bacterium]
MDLAAETADAQGDPDASVVLLHPHPQMGGDMHSPVTAHLFSHLPDSGVSVLRFDFRGAGRSGGAFGGGSDETNDVRAAIAEQCARTEMPVWLVGWSFGADVSLLVDDPNVLGWVCVTPPLSQPGIADVAGRDPRPKHLLVAEHDQFRDPESAAVAVEGWVNTGVAVIKGADHFLAGRLHSLADSVVDLVRPAPDGDRAAADHD